MANREDRNELENLIGRYSDQFREPFPTEMVKGMDESTMKDIIRRCLDTGEPFEPDFDPDADY